MCPWISTYSLSMKNFLSKEMNLWFFNLITWKFCCTFNHPPSTYMTLVLWPIHYLLFVCNFLVHCLVVKFHNSTNHIWFESTGLTFLSTNAVEQDINCSWNNPRFSRRSYKQSLIINHILKHLSLNAGLYPLHVKGKSVQPTLNSVCFPCTACSICKKQAIVSTDEVLY